MATASARAMAPANGRDDVDFAGLTAFAGFTIHLANLLLYRDFYERFAGNAPGLTLGAASVMAVIGANPGIRQGAAAEALLIKRSNMTKLINQLERRGLVGECLQHGLLYLLDKRQEGRALRDVGSQH